MTPKPVIYALLILFVLMLMGILGCGSKAQAQVKLSHAENALAAMLGMYSNQDVKDCAEMGWPDYCSITARAVMITIDKHRKDFGIK